MKSTRVIVRKSRTHGHGVFAQRTMTQGEVVRDGHLRLMRKFGGYNHSCAPNVVLARYHGDILAVILRTVRPNEELVVSYGLPAQMRKKFTCNCSSCRRSK